MEENVNGYEKCKNRSESRPDMGGKINVVASSYDAICSFFGSGAVEEGEASDVSGTVTVFRTISYKSGNLGADAKVYESIYEAENARIVGGSNNLGGGLIEWAKQCYY